MKKERYKLSDDSSRFAAISAVLLVLTILANHLAAQDYNWYNPKASPGHVEGQAWPDEVDHDYDRLPASAAQEVREAVWNLAKHTAGLSIRFRTNAKEIRVRYQVEGNHAMEHMPATGVTGVDLYAIDSDGRWMWCRGHRSFDDTIQYTFQHLITNNRYHDRGHEYRLYFPLYNSVSWIEIGVADTTYFRLLPVRQEKPIVIYGTSIAQGACASRPGMAWSNILARQMDRPVINLAFSGNGRLEPELLKYIGEIDAKIFVVDCLPNLTNAKLYSDEELSSRIKNTVLTLRTAQGSKPILLTDHAGYTDGSIDMARYTAYTRVNTILRKTYQNLLKEGVDHLHHLTHEEIGIQMDDMVDGTHPNDLGMMRYAAAYEIKLRKILVEPKGLSSTTTPCTQYREPYNYDWEERHQSLITHTRKGEPKKAIIANSIVHFWGGKPVASIARDTASWSKYFDPKGLFNFSFGWDRLENVLWRIYHDELEGHQFQQIILVIGTNNLHLNTDDEIVEGITFIIDGIVARQPDTHLTILGILPRRKYEQRIRALNTRLALVAKRKGISYHDIGDIFLLQNERINEDLFSDGLHPNIKGYTLLAPALNKIIDN